MKEYFVLNNGLKGFVELKKEHYIIIDGIIYHAEPVLIPDDDEKSNWALRYYTSSDEWLSESEFIFDDKVKELFLADEYCIKRIRKDYLAKVLLKESSKV